MLKNAQKDFIQRHIGPSVDEQNVMLKELGYQNLDDLIKDTVPEKILLKDDLDIGDPNSEYKALRKLKDIAKKNKVYSSFIGMGYYGTYTPYVILRNILENPGWYTSYTPYQPEVAQGRLEMLLNFQQMIIDFTGMDIANASLLDEGTAAAEAMSLLFSVRERDQKKNNTNKFFVSETLFPQSIDVIVGHAKNLGIELTIGNANEFTGDNSFFGSIVQYPDAHGCIDDLNGFISKMKAQEIKIAVAASSPIPRDFK